jgi:hypothetical protein
MQERYTNLTRLPAPLRLCFSKAGFGAGDVDSGFDHHGCWRRGQPGGFRRRLALLLACTGIATTTTPASAQTITPEFTGGARFMRFLSDGQGQRPRSSSPGKPGDRT